MLMDRVMAIHVLLLPPPSKIIKQLLRLCRNNTLPQKQHPATETTPPEK
jgi:hypothetical protein